MSDYGEQFRADFYNRFNEARTAKGKSTATYTNKSEIVKKIGQDREATAGQNARSYKKAATAKKTSTSKKSTSVSSSTKKVGEGVSQVAVHEELRSQGEKKGFLDTLLHAAARPIDIIARPSYAVSEGLRSAAQHIGEGESFWEVGDDLGVGMFRGITGDRKTGFGDFVDEVYYQDVKDGKSDRLNNGYQLPKNVTRNEDGILDPNVVQDMWHNMDKGNRVARRVVGGSIAGDEGVGKFAIGIGDLAADPATYVSFGTASALKKGAEQGLSAGVKAGLAKGSEGLIEAGVKGTARAVKKGVVRDSGTALSEAVREVAVDSFNKGLREVNPSLAARMTERVGFKEAESNVSKALSNFESASNKIVDDTIDLGPHPKIPDKVPKDSYKRHAKKLDSAEKDIRAFEAKKMAIDMDTELLRKDALEVVPDWARGTDAGKKLVDKLTDPIRKIKMEDVSQLLIKAAKEVEDKGTAAIDDILGPRLPQTLSQKTDDLITEFVGGSLVGGAARGTNPRMFSEFPQMLAGQGMTHFRDPLMNKLDELAPAIQATLKGDVKKMPKALLNQVEDNKYFKKFYDELINNADKMTPEQAGKVAMEAARDAINKDADIIYQHMLQDTKGLVLRSPVLRVWNGKELVLRRKGGDLLDRIGKRMGDNSFIEGMRKSLSYSHNMPGPTSILAQKIKSSGFEGFETYRKLVLDGADGFPAAREFNRKERQLINKALEDGSKIEGRMAEAVDAIRAEHRKMFDDEIAYGIRSAKDVYDPTAGYVYLRGGSATKRRAFKDLRKKELEAFGEIRTATWAEAARRGLRPEKDAFVNLLAHKAENNRKFVNAWYTNDLTVNFATVMRDLKGTGREATNAANDLVKVEKSKLSKELRESLKPDENFYLPTRLHHTMTVFEKLSSGQFDDDLQQWLRIVDGIHAKFKAASTLPFPSYHFNNMVGDSFMGWLDGVKLRDYFKLEGDGTKLIKIGDEMLPRSRVRAAYDEMASAGGFYNTDIASSSLGRAGNAFKNASETRENFGRMAHFVHAMDEEFPAAKKLFPNNPDKAWKLATENATARVNLYKFDYSAVTPFEKNVMKRLVPFYTYQRKALPILTQSLLMSPRKMMLTGRFLDMFDDSNLDDTDIPSWVKDMGYTPLTGGANPTVLTHNTLPTGVFNDLFNPGSNGDSSTQNLAKGMISKTSPLLQIPFEWKSGEQTFTGKKLGQGNVPLVADAILSHVRPVSAVGQARRLSLDNPAGIAKFITGVPVTKITDGMQKAAFKEQEDIMQGNVYQVNNSLSKHGLKLGYVKRTDPATNQEVMEYRIYQIDPTTKKSYAIRTGMSTFEEASKMAQSMVNG